MLFGRAGPLGRPLYEHLGIEIAFTWRAVVLASAVVAFPLFVRSARSAFEEVDPRLPAGGRPPRPGAVPALFPGELPPARRRGGAGARLGLPPPPGGVGGPPPPPPHNPG